MIDETLPAKLVNIAQASIYLALRHSAKAAETRGGATAASGPEMPLPYGPVKSLQVWCGMGLSILAWCVALHHLAAAERSAPTLLLGRGKAARDHIYWDAVGDSL